MANYSVSCDGVALDEAGGLYSLAVYTDGEGFNSYVSYSSDVALGAENRQTELLDVQEWLTDIWRSHDKKLVVVDASGNARHFDGADWSVLEVSGNALTCIWGIDEHTVFTAGDAGIVYRWDGRVWAPISAALGTTIFCVRGTSDRNLYACGERGAFFHYDGTDWTRIELPTNQRLLGLLVLAPNDTLVCGNGGVLFRGDGTDWHDISQPIRHLFSMAHFQGGIYVAGAASGIFRLQDDSLEPVKGLTSYKLSSNKNFLASSGDQLAARFDGSLWFGTRFD